MSDYVSNLDLPAVAQVLNGAERITVLTHARPDGDAWGAVVALTQTLRDMGKQVTAAFAPPVPKSLIALPGHDLTITLNGDTSLPDADCIVVVDTGAWSQCEPYETYLKPRLDRMLILDHHLTGDINAARRYIDTTAAATCEIVAELIPLLLADRKPRPQVYSALFVGIATDTGFFRYSNTSPRTLRLAAQLIEQGVDHAGLHEHLELCERYEKLQLTCAALNSLQWAGDRAAAVMVLRLADFQRTEALEEETEGLVNLPLRIGGVRVSVLICEKQTESGVICRLSFRSKAASPALDVAHLAGTFNGGGHARAAGARVTGNASAVLPRIIAVLEKSLA